MSLTVGIYRPYLRVCVDDSHFSCGLAIKDKEHGLFHAKWRQDVNRYSSVGYSKFNTDFYTILRRKQ